MEDVHWIDPTSQELLGLLIPKLATLRVFLVMTCRLEAVQSWAGHPGVTSLTLNRLDPNQGARFGRDCTGGKALPPEVLAEIVARTDGVPLFVQELTRPSLSRVPLPWNKAITTC